MEVVKHFIDVLTSAFQHIVNISIDQSKFPRRWKHELVVPFSKNGNLRWRPINLLPISNKILELEMNNHFCSNIEIGNWGRAASKDQVSS